MRMLEKYDMFRSLPLDELQAFDVTPAAKWFLAENEREEYDVVEDFHRVIPPYPAMWMEFEHPPFTYSRQRGQNHAPAHSLGLSTLTIEVRDGFMDFVVPLLENGENVQGRFVQELFTQYADAVTPLKASAYVDQEPLLRKIRNGENIRWVWLSTLYTTSPWVCRLMQKKCTPLVTRFSFLNETGGMMPKFVDMSPVTSYIADHDEQLEFGLNVGSTLLPFYFSLQLLHCKNVETADIAVAPKVKSKRLKSGSPDIKYKLLSVSPMRKAMQAQSTATSGDSVRKALHFARGHFKDFSQGSGLFGKYKGLYWWGDQVRGSATAGVIDKDYRVTN